MDGILNLQLYCVQIIAVHEFSITEKSDGSPLSGAVACMCWEKV